MVTHTRIPFSDLVFLDDNPRTRTPEGLQQMAADIQADPTFFENRPVLVNLTAGTHQVYAGDLRAHAAHDVLGWADIPCIVERDVPPDVMRRRAIIDNLHRETWAPDILTSSWATDDLEGWGLTPDKWGDAADTPDTPAGGYTASEDDYDPPAEIVTDIVPGDLFEIGPHRLLCGDSTDSDAVARLIGGGKVDMVYTDPPYGINEKTDRVENVKTFKKQGIAKKGKYEPIIGDNSIQTALDAYSVSLTISDTIVYWGGNYYAGSLPSSACWVVWDKRVEENQRDINSDCELAYVKHPHKKSVRIFRHLWKGMIKASEQGESRVHPTQKPVVLADWCMKEFDPDGKTVCDLFLGSGTTMVAAHQLHRRCYGIEIDPKYCHVIIHRMHKLDPTLTITRNGKPYTPA